MNNWWLKATCPEHPPPARQKPSPSGCRPDPRASCWTQKESQHRPAGHRATAVKGTHPFTGTHAQGGLPCATTDQEPGGHPRKRSAGVSSLRILGSQ